MKKNLEIAVMATSLGRMLAVFDAFSAQHPVLTAEDIMKRMRYSRGTAYRYVRELVAAGFLTRVAGSAYTLGPRIIELDFAIRQCDPVLSAGIPIMQSLRHKFDCDVLLASFYEDRVVVTHHEHCNNDIKVSYGRGRTMPLFLGAPAKAILAWLPVSKQKKLYAGYAQDISAAGLGESWEEFRSYLAAIRKAGHCVSFAELDSGNVGVAIPLETEPANSPASLSLVFSKARYDIVDKALVLQILQATAAQINRMTQRAPEPADDGMEWIRPHKGL